MNLKFTKISASLIVLSLFFPIRHVFLTPEAYLTGQYSDFTSFSLYLSDILILTTWFLLLISRGKYFWLKIKGFFLSPKPYTLNPILWLIFVIFLGFITHFGLNTRLNVFFLAKWLELIVAYGTLVVILKELRLKALVLKLFAWFTAFEAILALVQFVRQGPVGLFRLGEQHISPNILGIAKIVSGGTTYIRAYGTFPHPNPLSAFLVAGVFLALYLLATSANLRWELTYSGLVFLNILGLTVTFSRGAYLALAVGLVIFFGCLGWRHPERVHPSEGSPNLRDSSSSAAFLLRMTPVTVVFISLLISFFLFKPFLLTRATFSDQSTIDRKFYDVVGVKMAVKNPIFGVGLGESLLHMEQYSGKSLQPWDKQPPHNYFILAAAEMGIPSALILLWLLLNHFWKIFRKLKFENNFLLSIEYLALSTILICFLLLMLFDHYFYTLEQTQLLLWLILALIASEIQTKKA